MSKPANILSKYRSYSYHHVLAICDSTDTALELSESPVLNEVFSSRESVERLKLLETVNGGRYIILIDGFADAKFVIQSVRWATVLAPDNGLATPTTVETDGRMTILEPQGVRFMNILSSAASSLLSDPIGLIFVLKTFFVGHIDTGETEIISNIRPLFFVLIDIQANIDETGAEYDLEFVGMCNGAAKLPYVNSIASAVSVSAPGKSTTLRDIFENILQAKIKELYIAERERLKTLYSELDLDDTLISQNYRDVSYKFILHEDYDAKYKFGSNIKFTNHNSQDDPILEFSNNVTIEEIIHAIMMSSAEVVDEANNPKEKYMFKITSAITSTSEDYIVTFYINRFKQHTPTIDSALETGERFKPPPGSVIEFDYIFSGKNIDITDFNIKMEMGLAFFQILATTSNIPNQKEAYVGTNVRFGMGGSGSASNTKANSDKNALIRTKTPLFLGGQTRSALSRNYVKAVSSINFQSMLARWAAIENIQTKVCIAGNPQLLDELSVRPIDLENRKTEDPKEDETIAPTWMTTPMFAKVNIMMPVDKTASDSSDFAESFWFDGYYQIYMVDNIFEGGLFKQELEMFSIPYGDPLNRTSDDTEIQPTSSRSGTNARNASIPQDNTGLSSNDALVITNYQQEQILRGPSK